MQKRKSKLLQTLRTAEDLMILFYDYFHTDTRKIPTLDDWLCAGVRSTKNYFIKKGVLNPDLTFKQKPESILKLIKKPWDKKWRFVVFDIPQKNKTARDLIRRRLKEWDFKFFQRSVWFSPLPLTDKIRQLDKQIDDTNYLGVIEGKILRCDPRKIIEEKWEVHQWKNKANSWKQKLKKERKLSEELQLQFWDLVSQHPKVPLDLLPSTWPLKTIFKLFAQKKLKI